MKIFNRSVLMKVHAILAVFMLPVAIMFFVTGGLYIWDIKGSFDISVHELHLKQPVRGDLDELVLLAGKELKKLNIAPPVGEAKIKKIDGSLRLEWVSASTEVFLISTAQPLVLKLEVKIANWYGKFVQLHKAKGGTLFKVYATILATALLLLLVTGFVMAWQIPKLRKLTALSTILGIIVFILMVGSS